MPGFNEMSKHHSDFDKSTKKDGSFIGIMKEGLSSVGGMFLDIGSDIAGPIHDKHLDSRIEQDTRKLEHLCEYARVTGNKIFLHYSPKYEKEQCYAFLVTDGDTRLLIEGNSLINLIRSGTLVISGCGLANYMNELIFVTEKRWKESQYQYNWIICPIEFPKEHCSNLRVISKSMKQYLRQSVR